VVTGEGRLDAGTLEGKVVAAVLVAARTLPALVVTGRADRTAVRALRASVAGPLDVVELGTAEQRERGTAAAIESAVGRWLESRG
ncbi:MAG TPA: glycerate kinase, partial [Acidimicrobiales bacterium]|nr:glycerate kinase [Acidimicrobiales bacterium]